eukprot:877575_1
MAHFCCAFILATSLVSVAPDLRFHLPPPDFLVHVLDGWVPFDTDTWYDIEALCGLSKIAIEYFARRDPDVSEYKFGEFYKRQDQLDLENSVITINGGQYKYVSDKCAFYAYSSKGLITDTPLSPVDIHERLRDAWKAGSTITIKPDDASAVRIPPMEDPPKPEFQIAFVDSEGEVESVVPYIGFALSSPIHDRTAKPKLQIKYAKNWKVGTDGASGHYEFQTNTIEVEDSIWIDGTRYYFLSDFRFMSSGYRMLFPVGIEKQLWEAWKDGKVIKYYSSKDATILPSIEDHRFPPQFKLFLTTRMTTVQTTIPLKQGDTIYHVEERVPPYSLPILWQVDMHLTPELLVGHKTHPLMAHVNHKLERNWINDKDSKFEKDPKIPSRFLLTSRTPQEPVFKILRTTHTSHVSSHRISSLLYTDTNRKDTLAKMARKAMAAVTVVLQIEYIDDFKDDYKFATHTLADGDAIIIAEWTYVVQLIDLTLNRLIKEQKQKYVRADEATTLLYRAWWVDEKPIVVQPKDKESITLKSWKDVRQLRADSTGCAMNPPQIQIGIIYNKGDGFETYIFQKDDTLKINDDEAFKFNYKEQKFEKRLFEVKNDLSEAWKEGKVITMGKFKWDPNEYTSVVRESAHGEVMNDYPGESYTDPLKEHQLTHSDHSHELNGFHSLRIADHKHYQPLIRGEYVDTDASGSGSSLIIGGVVGASATVIIVLVFCLGLAFGMIIYGGYSRKRALDVKRRNTQLV